jgi:aminocarboxymuconate-semialdehyde decarboxylase
MISNRREMLRQAAGALTGLASIGCSLVNSTLAQAPQRRREVVVNGKRVRTVDLHAHCHVPEANVPTPRDPALIGGEGRRCRRAPHNRQQNQ